MRFGWARRANRLLTALSAFCFGRLILLSVTFPPFGRIDCVLHVWFFWKNLIRKSKTPTLLLKIFIGNQSFRSYSDFSLVHHRGFCFSMRLHRRLLLLQNKHRLNACAFRFPLSIIWLRLFMPSFLLRHSFVIHFHLKLLRLFFHQNSLRVPPFASDFRDLRLWKFNTKIVTYNHARNLVLRMRKMIWFTVTKRSRQIVNGPINWLVSYLLCIVASQLFIMAGSRSCLTDKQSTCRLIHCL